jgi:SAM-dependent methyltransferase
MAEPGWTPRFVRDAPLCDGIYRCLTPARRSEIEPLVAHYRGVRETDGYRQRSPAYYRSLPQVDAQHPQAATWRVRQQSFRHLGGVLRRFGGRGLRVLDLGAGSGWLCHRLAALGHSCVALDWLDDVEDGLGAFRYYPVAFTCIQADFDDLPLAPGQFDVAIFNASLHYARDPAQTLQHARQTLVPGGILVVMDSPVFESDDDGRRMLAAPQFDVRANDGTPVRWGAGYLTEAGLRRAAGEANLDVRWMPSYGGPGWALKRRLAGLKERRAPAKFGLWFGVWQPQSS